MFGMVLFAAQSPMAAGFDKLLRFKLEQPLQRSMEKLEAAEAAVRRSVETEIVVPHADESLKDLLVRVCGEARPDLVEKFNELNPGGFPEGIPESAFRPPVRIPACLYFQRDAQVVAAPGETIDEIWERTTGTPYDSAAERALETIHANRGVSLSEIEAGTTITLPFRVKPLVVGAEAAAALVALPPPGVSIDEQDVQTAFPLSLAELAPEDVESCRDAESTDPAIWPFPADQVRALVKRYAKLLDDEPAQIVMIDSGFHRSVIRNLPLSDLKDQCPRDPELDLHAGGRMHRGRCDYPPWDTDSEHGTLTASVAAGGKSIIETPFVLPSAPLRLHLYGLGAPGKSVVSSDIGNALEAARDAVAAVGGFPIVNVSYMTQDDFSTISAVFSGPRKSGHQRELAIVAAGNAPSEDLDVMERPISPASYGREESWNVLTVGALRPDGKLLSSSKFGEYTVGLAAPGCGVSAWGKDSWMPVDGTSIAAPVVTFAAALLRAEGLRNSREILHRLLVSAERSDKLAGYVRDGRVLNVPDAITVFEDVVVLDQDGVKSRIVGRIQTTDEIARDRFVSALNGISVPAKVARIDRITLAAPSQWRAVATLEDVGAGSIPLLRAKTLKMSRSTFNIEDQAGEIQTINLGDVSHIIFRAIDPAETYPGRPYRKNFAPP